MARWRHPQIHETDAGFGLSRIGGEAPSLGHRFCTASSVWVAAFAGTAGWGAEGPIIFWLTASWLLILAMAGLAALVVSIAPTWVIALSAGICLIAPTFPFTGFPSLLTR